MTRQDVLPEQQVRPVSQPNSQQRTHDNIAHEVHSQDDPRNRNAEGQDEQSRLQLRIENAQRYRDSERAHRVAGWERELVWRKNLGPAVRLHMAWALPFAGFL